MSTFDERWLKQLNNEQLEKELDARAQASDDAVSSYERAYAELLHRADEGTYKA